MKKTELTNQDLFIYQQIIAKGAEVTKAHFAYTFSMNMDAVEPHIKAIEKARTEPSTPAYSKYQKDREAILEKGAKKDDEGQSITRVESLPNGDSIRHFDLEDTEKTTKALARLTKKSTKAIESEQKRLKALNSLMSTKVKVELTPFKMS